MQFIQYNFSILEWDGFILSENELLPTAKETWAGLKVVIDQVLIKNGISLFKPAGPPTNRRGTVRR